ncbi:IclR family transcriptional regulator [Streptomyces sp. NPDC006872]|uniref:IclR family transcriptional regulator n=1 Tax=Streptomyces sp. NPDC006872 TaxID=3155720 RepID=UPI0034096BE2
MSEGRGSMLERGIGVLQAFRPYGQTLTLAALVERTGLAKATVHRLADELVELGLLERRRVGYRLGIGLFELGELVHTKSNLRAVALPFMGDLYEISRETVHLAVPDGTDVVYAEKLCGHNSAEVPSRVGGRLPMSCTAGGKALLAHADRETVEKALSRPLRKLTDRSLTHPAELNQQLAEIRRTGLAFDSEETASGVSCIAVPIFVEGTARAALSLTMATERLVAPNIGPALRAVGFAFGRAMHESKQRYLESAQGRLVRGNW